MSSDFNARDRRSAGRRPAAPDFDAIRAVLATLPDIQFRVLMAQRKGEDLAAAAARQGVSRATVDRWMSGDERFVGALVQIAIHGLGRDHPRMIELERQAARVVADAARRGDTDAIRFIIDEMQQRKRDAAEEN